MQGDPSTRMDSPIIISCAISVIRCMQWPSSLWAFGCRGNWLQAGQGVFCSGSKPPSIYCWQRSPGARAWPTHPRLLVKPACGCVQVLSAIRASAKELGVSTLELMSKPYHDAAFMGLVAPTAMIFVPCQGGLSHHPDEYSSPKNVGDGVRTLALTLAKLAGSADSAHTEL